jgi:drug/metabolite transporter (DMT)-like permease
LNKIVKAHLAVLVANLLFGANYSIVKVITPGLIKPFGLNVVRVIVTVALFWLLYALKPSDVSIQKKHIPRLILCGIAGVAINQLLFIKGLSLTTSIHASLLSLGSPIFITFIAAWLLKEPISPLKIIGLIIGICGATLLITMKEGSSAGDNVVLGDVLVLLNAISYAFYFALIRPLMEIYKPLVLLRWIFTIGAMIIIPIGWRQFTEIDWSAFSFADFAEVAFVAIGATFIAYLLNMYGIQHIGPSMTGSYIYTQPVFAAIIAIVFLGEAFNWQKALAAVLIIIGVVFVNKRTTSTLE